MNELATYAGVRHILEKYDIKVKKNYGQNFLTDQHVLQKIIDASGVTKAHLAIEVGPGIGGLTQALAAQAGKVVAIEIDNSLIPVLNDIFCNYDNVEILHADILKTDINTIINANPGLRVAVVANLPYYITTPILMGLLEQKLPLESITVMMQKEVAQRIKAQPGTRDYGALTLGVQYYADAYLAANVPPNAFIPRPGVDSAVLKLTPHTAQPVPDTDEKTLFHVVKAAFGQRRKTLVNCLYNTGEWAMTKDELALILQSCGFSTDVRGETLALADFAHLAKALRKSAAESTSPSIK